MTLIVFPQRYLMPHAALRPAAAGGAFVPTDLGVKLRAWWDYTDTANLWQNDDGTGAVSSDTDPVGRVTDKSGNGKHLIQATSGNKPAYRTSPGRVRFDGSNDYLACASAAFPTDAFELFFVAAQHAAKTNNAGLVVFAPSSGNDYDQTTGMALAMGIGTQWMGWGATGISAYITATPPFTLALYEAEKKTTTVNIGYNGANFTADSSFTAQSSPHTGNFYNGCRWTAGAVTGAYCPVDFRDMLITAALDGTERTNVRNYLYAKHGITP